MWFLHVQTCGSYRGSRRRYTHGRGDTSASLVLIAGQTRFSRPGADDKVRYQSRERPRDRRHARRVRSDNVTIILATEVSSATVNDSPRSSEGAREGDRTREYSHRARKVRARGEGGGRAGNERRKSIEGTVRSGSTTAAWALGYTRKRSVVLGPAIRRGWLGGEELSAPLKSVGTVCN